VKHTAARERDPFGRALYDRFRGHDANVVIERDDGYVDIDETGRSYLAEYRDWWPHQRRALRYVRGRVLDLGCGAGRVGVELQRRGYEVVGIDNSDWALRVCRARGFRRVRRLAITKLGAQLGVFDTLILYGNNFGLLGTPQRARRLLRQFSRITSPKARIIAESLDPYRTDQPEHLAYHAQNRGRGRLGGQVRIRVRYLCGVSPYFDWLLASKPEMEQIVAGTGWRVERYLDSRGPLYIAILRKA
jgi:SAM-dependent methyltransferase